MNHVLSGNIVRNDMLRSFRQHHGRDQNALPSFLSKAYGSRRQPLPQTLSTDVYIGSCQSQDKYRPQKHQALYNSFLTGGNTCLTCTPISLPAHTMTPLSPPSNRNTIGTAIASRRNDITGSVMLGIRRFVGSTVPSTKKRRTRKRRKKRTKQRQKQQQSECANDYRTLAGKQQHRQQQTIRMKEWGISSIHEETEVPTEQPVSSSDVWASNHNTTSQTISSSSSSLSFSSFNHSANIGVANNDGTSVPRHIQMKMNADTTYFHGMEGLAKSWTGPSTPPSRHSAFRKIWRELQQSSGPIKVKNNGRGNSRVVGSANSLTYYSQREKEEQEETSTSETRREEGEGDGKACENNRTATPAKGEGHDDQDENSRKNEEERVKVVADETKPGAKASGNAIQEESRDDDDSDNFLAMDKTNVHSSSSSSSSSLSSLAVSSSSTFEVGDVVDVTIDTNTVERGKVVEHRGGGWYAIELLKNTRDEEAPRVVKRRTSQLSLVTDER